ncbi:MAG: phosphatidate cytidylyltransferase [Planctomycetota bacterium]|jgi:phosphatidate cytidylyltransferase|nr:phosphatidate cytidylyltransferase [Planctomycetota bacterium]
MTDTPRNHPPPSEPVSGPAPRQTRNLALRAGSAITAILLVYLAARWDVAYESGWACAILTAAGAALCLREFYRLAVMCGFFPFSRFGRIVGPLWVLALEWDLGGGARAAGMPAAAATLAMAVLMTGSMLLQLTRKSNHLALSSVALTMFGFLYCCWLPGFVIHLRHLAFSPSGWPMDGVEFVLVCIFLTKVSDIGALLVGGRWGARKLIPRLSPGKTWEGALGGLAFSVLLMQFMAFTNPIMALARLGWARLALLSFLMSAVGLLGDLVESCFKRNSRMKDAGSGVPGFGGVLDLFDSVYLTLPVMYFFALIHGARYVP